MEMKKKVAGMAKEVFGTVEQHPFFFMSPPYPLESFIFCAFVPDTGIRFSLMNYILIYPLLIQANKMRTDYIHCESATVK